MNILFNIILLNLGFKIVVYYQLKMEISAKIKSLLTYSRPILTMQDMLQHFDSRSTTSGMINFGLSHPNQMICSFRALNLHTQVVTFGTLLMQDLIGFFGVIVDRVQRKELDLQHIAPYAVFDDQSVRFEDVIKARKDREQPKIGKIMQRKLVVRKLQRKDSKAPDLKKKQSQKTTTTAKTEKPVPPQKPSKPLQQTGAPKQQVKHDQITNNKKPTEIKQVQKQEKPQKQEKTEKQDNKKLKVQSGSDSDSDDYQKILKNYEIKVPSTVEEMKDQIQNQDKQYHVLPVSEPQIGEKCENAKEKPEQDIDDMDAFELIMQKQKIKSEAAKVENRNTNLPNNTINMTNKQEIKPKPFVAPAEKVVNKGGGQQLGIDSFFIKKK